MSASNGVVSYTTEDSSLYSIQNSLVTQYKVGVKIKLLNQFDKSWYADIQNSNELLYFDGKSLEKLESPLFERIQTLFVTKSGVLWIITNENTILISGDRLLQIFKNNSKLSSMRITNFLQDRMSNLWVSSTNAGVGIITPSFFSKVNFPNDLVDKSSSFLFVDSARSIYAELKDGGLLRKDNDGQVYQLSLKELKGIEKAVEHKNEILLTSKNGLFRISDNSIERLIVENSKCGNIGFTDIILGADGFYFGEHDGCLFHLNDKLTKISLNSPIQDIELWKDNTLCISTASMGIATVQNDTLVFANYDSGFPSNLVSSSAKDEDGRLLIASNRGLFFVDVDGKINELLADDLGSHHYNNCIYVKASKEFWASNAQDLYNLKLDSSGQFSIIKFSKNDFSGVGVIKSNQLFSFNRSVFFKIGQEISQYQWFNFSYLEETPKLGLSSVIIKKEGSLVKRITNPIDEDLELEPGSYSFTFNYDVNFWGSEDKLRFEYRLKGYSDEWQGPINRRTIDFPALNNGEYELQVRANLQNDIHIEDLSYGFSIQLPFYKTKLFVISAIIASLLIIYFLTKSFSKLNFESIESYTSYSALIKKMRMLSILGGILIPLVAFYESEALNLYVANWPLVGLIAVSYTHLTLPTIYSV